MLTGADVPGENDSGPVRHDEPLFPTEVMFHSQPVAWVLGDTLDAARAGAARVQAAYEPLPAILTIEQAIEAGSFLTEPLRLARGDMAALAGSPLRVEGELAIGGQEHFYLETQSAIAWLDESGGIAVHSSTQHPSETQADRRARPRRAQTRGDGRVPPHGRRVRRQGSAGQRLGRGRGARRVEDAAAGARAADPRARHGAHRQAASVPGAVPGGLVGRRPAAGADAGALLGRRLEPRPVRADHVARALPLRQRLPPARRGRGGPRVPHAQDLADRVPRLRRPAGHAGHRGDPGAAPPRSSSLPAHVVRERNFYRDGDTTHYGQPVEQAGRISDIWTRLKETSRFDDRRDGRGRVQRAAPRTSSAGWRSRRSSSASPSRPRSSTRPARWC